MWFGERLLIMRSTESNLETKNMKRDFETRPPLESWFLATTEPVTFSVSLPGGKGNWAVPTQRPDLPRRPGGPRGREKGVKRLGWGDDGAGITNPVAVTAVTLGCYSHNIGCYSHSNVEGSDFRA